MIPRFLDWLIARLDSISPYPKPRPKATLHEWDRVFDSAVEWKTT